MNVEPTLQQIRAAMLNGEFSHAYQPIVDLHDSSVVGVEALVRWESPSTAHVSPSVLLDKAEQSNLSSLLTQITLDNVLGDLAALRDTYHADLKVHVNLNASQLGDPDAIRIFDEAIESGLDPRYVVVEIVEDLTSDHLESSAKTIADLQTRDIEIVLDDFGTGAGTLSLLTDLSYDGLKIDRHFVSRMRLGGAARSVVEFMVSFAHDNNLTLVAEGVEDVSILDGLRSLGCRYAQGYYLGRPASISTLRQAQVQRPRLAKRTELTSKQIESWKATIDERVPLRPGYTDTTLRHLLAPLEEEVLAVAGEAGEELRLHLGERKTLAATYGGLLGLAAEWGLATSRHAERGGQLGRAARVLSTVACAGADPVGDLGLAVNAFARALSLRRSNDLAPIDAAATDNNLGAALAHLGLLDQATDWWMSSLDADIDSKSRALAAVNLADACFDKLSGEVWSGSTEPKSTTLTRLDRALSVVCSSAHCPPGLRNATEARVAIVHGEIDLATRLIDAAELFDWTPILFADAMVWALLAEAAGDADEFLYTTAGLLGLVEGHPGLRLQALRASSVRTRALVAAGQHAEAFELATRVAIDQQFHTRRYVGGFLEWMQIGIDVDLRYDEVRGLSLGDE